MFPRQVESTILWRRDLRLADYPLRLIGPEETSEDEQNSDAKQNGGESHPNPNLTFITRPTEGVPFRHGRTFTLAGKAVGCAHLPHRFHFSFDAPAIDGGIFRRLITFLRILLQAPRYQLLKFRFQIRNDVSHGRRLRADDFVEQRAFMFAAERRHTGDHLMQQNAKRPYVGSRINILTLHLLRRHIHQCTDS